MHKRIRNVCLLSLTVFFVASCAHAITTFTVNGQNELDIVDADSILFFEADVAQPGGTLSLEFYADANGNGLIDPGLDANLLARFQQRTITDGGSGYPFDTDGLVNGLVKFKTEPADILPGFAATGLILRLTDEDGSSAQILVHAILPEFAQSIAGQVVSSAGEPLPGVLVLVVTNPGLDAEPVFFPSDMCLPFQLWDDFEPVRDELSPPILAVTDASGMYHVSVDAGEILVQALPKPGFYIPLEEDADNFLGTVGTQIVTVAIDDQLAGIDFVLFEDTTPPVIEHEPLVEPVPYEGIVLEAQVTDDESGVQAVGAEFLLTQTAPTIFFRPVGSDEPFRQRMMYPHMEGIEPYPMPTEPHWEPEILEEEEFAASEDGASVDPAFDEGSSNGSQPDRGGIDMGIPFPWVDYWDGFQAEDFETFLAGYDLDADGIEYYIVAYDRAGNMATAPADAPATLFVLELAPSDFSITGHIHTADGDGLGGVSINATSVDLEGDYEFLWIQSRADGSYVLPVPAQGVWQVTVAPPREYYFVDPGDATVTVTVLRPGAKDGIDFTVVEDLEPPVIVHDPETDVTAQAAGDEVQIRARISDDSGRAYATVNLVPLNVPLEGEKWIDEIRGFAIPEVEEGEDADEWLFTIPAELVRRDFGYAIVAWDLAGHSTSHPEAGIDDPYIVHLEPAPYQIVGTVTDVDGNPLAGIDLYFTTIPTDFPFDGNDTPDIPDIPDLPDGIPGIGGIDLDDLVDVDDLGDMVFPDDIIHDISLGIRFARTNDEGRYSVPVKQGVWYVEFERYGLVLVETPEPVTVEAEGEYELNLVITVDDEPPVIVHTPPTEYSFGEAMIVQAEVTDNAELEEVWLALYHTLEDDIDFAFPVEPGDVEDGDAAALEEDFDEFLTEFEDSIAPWRGGEYCTYVPMSTADGVHYEANLWHEVIRSPLSSIDAVRYVVCAVDTAGNATVSPGDAPAERHVVPVEISQSVTGQVSIDEVKYGGFKTIVVQLVTADGTLLWTRPDDEGRYWFPASVGENAISVEFHPGYLVAAPEAGPREVVLETGQHADGVDFDLESRRPVRERPRERWVDVNDDSVVDILDLVQIGQHFGETINAEELPAGASNPDTNGDGIVDILDLVAAAQAFGTQFDQMAAPSLAVSADISVSAVPLTRGNGMATIALQMDAGAPIAGIQFSLGLQSDQATLLNVSKGNMLDNGPNPSFWLQPQLRGNTATAAASIALRPSGGQQASGQFAVLTLGLSDAVMANPAEISLDSLVLVTKNGERLNARVQPIQLDVESLILPERDVLLANYPNPFNPETWIPYHLSQGADVQLQIFSSTGQLIRSLDIGHQEAGIYANRARAAYWDGRNNLGERIASGVYFYSLQAGDYHAIRRMLIAK